MEYKTTKIGNLVDINQRNLSKDMRIEYMYYLDTGNITRNRIDEIKYFDVKKDKIPSRARRIPKEKSILYSTVRPNQEHYGYLDGIDYENLIVSTGFVVIDVYEEIANSKYIYYFLTQNHITDYLQKIAETSVSTYPSIKPSDIEQLSINLPLLSYQNKVVSILSSFDKKIENNNAIITNLEAQAQAIFKSWFIDFEPFQDGEFVESELGMIPEGWEVGKLGNSSLGKLLSSGINDFENQKIYLATADVTDSNITNYETKITMEDKPSRANMQPIKNSVWFAKMKDSRKLIYVGANDDFLVDEVIFSTGFAGIKAVESSVHYLWTYLLTEDFNTKKNLLSNGTTMQAINNTNINRIKIVIPKNNVLEDFNGLVKPMFELISSYKNQNLKLAQIRDTLLPKLMSGEIRVGQDDIEEIENLL